MIVAIQVRTKDMRLYLLRQLELFYALLLYQGQSVASKNNTHAPSVG